MPTLINSILGGGITGLDIMPCHVKSIPILEFIVRKVSAFPPSIDGRYFHNNEVIHPRVSEAKAVKI